MKKSKQNVLRGQCCTATDPWGLAIIPLDGAAARVDASTSAAVFPGGQTQVKNEAGSLNVVHVVDGEGGGQSSGTDTTERVLISFEVRAQHIQLAYAAVRVES